MGWSTSWCATRSFASRRSCSTSPCAASDRLVVGRGRRHGRPRRVEGDRAARAADAAPVNLADPIVGGHVVAMAPLMNDDTTMRRMLTDDPVPVAAQPRGGDIRALDEPSAGPRPSPSCNGWTPRAYPSTLLAAVDVEVSTSTVLGPWSPLATWVLERADWSLRWGHGHGSCNSRPPAPPPCVVLGHARHASRIRATDRRQLSLNPRRVGSVGAARHPRTGWSRCSSSRRPWTADDEFLDRAAPRPRPELVTAASVAAGTSTGTRSRCRPIHDRLTSPSRRPSSPPR